MQSVLRPTQHILEFMAQTGAQIMPICTDSAISHPAFLEQRSNIGAASTTGLAREHGLEIRQADVISPWGSILDDLEVGAVDQQPARAVGRSHFVKDDLLLTYWNEITQLSANQKTASKAVSRWL